MASALAVSHSRKSAVFVELPVGEKARAAKQRNLKFRSRFLV
jgi:hypothetical protein